MCTEGEGQREEGGEESLSDVPYVWFPRGGFRGYSLKIPKRMTLLEADQTLGANSNRSNGKITYSRPECCYLRLRCDLFLALIAILQAFLAKYGELS